MVVALGVGYVDPFDARWKKWLNTHMNLFKIRPPHLINPPLYRNLALPVLAIGKWILDGDGGTYVCVFH